MGPLRLSAALAVLLAALATHCLDGGGTRPLGASCSAGDCAGGLLCLYGRCREPCSLDRDCPDGQRCFVQPESGRRACTLGEECSNDCPPGSVCVTGGTCVPLTDPPAGDGDADTDLDPDAVLYWELGECATAEGWECLFSSSSPECYGNCGRFSVDSFASSGEAYCETPGGRQDCTLDGWDDGCCLRMAQSGCCDPP